MSVATYHNHTSWSDGSVSVAELVERAGRLGVDELGISDHYVLHPSGRTPPWGMPVDRLADYVEDVRTHAGGTSPVVRLGLEVDWFPGQEEAIRDGLDGFPFDFVIGSVHEVDGFRVDASALDWDELRPEERNERFRLYWVKVRAMAESRLFDIVGHADLPKKFGHHPTTDLGAVIDEALDAVGRAGMIVELNTAGWHKPCADGYPTLELLRECHRRKIGVTLAADAHDPAHLLRDFPRGIERIRRAGYSRIARFRCREIVYESF
jgi:histidinol-phosphatase (PHP family)